MSLAIGSLFSGIGGLERGLELGLGGAVTRWQVEYEEHARLILAQHWPEAERHKDVRDVGSRNLAPVDLICGGWPCQPHSLAGKRLASRDERDLWGEFARVVGEVKPRWVVGENVPGLLSSADPAFSRDHPGGFFGRVLRDLAEMGFDAEWACFPAASVGAPHRRDRVFLVAHAQELLGNGRADHTGSDQEGPRPFPELGNGRGTADVAHARGRRGPDGGLQAGRAQLGSGGTQAGHVAHASRAGREEQHPSRVTGDAGHRAGRGDAPDWAGGGWEQPHPLSDVRGMADGAALRIQRLTRLGNGVVPQQAAVIGRAIRDAEAHWQRFGVMPERIIRPEHWSQQ